MQFFSGFEPLYLSHHSVCRTSNIFIMIILIYIYKCIDHVTVVCLFDYLFAYFEVDGVDPPALSESEHSIVEHLVCTKPLHSR